MPPRKSTRTKKADPPLPDEQPPLPDEQPPLPDEQPPLPDEQPPLPDEQPPLPDEQPPLPDEQPPLPDEKPPLPQEQPPLPSAPADEAQPITSLGDGDSDEDEDDSDGDDEGEEDNEGEGEEGGETSKGEGKKGKKDKKAKGKGKEGDGAHPWQAVWAPANNAYYFWNTDTGEVTWTNPLAPPTPAPPLPNEPPPPTSQPLSGTSTPGASLPPSRPGGLPEIDPALAHLLPAEQRDALSSSASAALAARTGRLAADNHYAFAALDEYSRQKRFNEHYFDVEGWEKAKAEEARKRRAEEEAGVSRERKITKKDMDRFRAKKAEQKHRRQAWLYD